MKRECTISQLLDLKQEERVFGVCAVPGGSHLQHEEKVMQYKERVFSIRSASSPVGGQGVWSKEKVCIINNITSAVREEKVCSTAIVTSAAQGQGCAV